MSSAEAMVWWAWTAVAGSNPLGCDLSLWAHEERCRAECNDVAQGVGDGERRGVAVDELAEREHGGDANDCTEDPADREAVEPLLESQ